MKRAKYMFLVLSFAYILIAVGKGFSLLETNNNILLGLSLTSLLLSLGDTISIIQSYKAMQNGLEYSLSWLSNKLADRIKANNYDGINYDIYNIKESIDNIKSVKKEPIHPLEYSKKKVVKVLRHIPIAFFGLGILCFVIIPFVKINISNNSIPQYLTIIAFAIMCFNMYWDEETEELQFTSNLVNGDKLCIINGVCPGILVEYTNHMQHYISSQKMEEYLKQLKEAADAATKTAELSRKQETK